MGGEGGGGENLSAPPPAHSTPWSIVTYTVSHWGGAVVIFRIECEVDILLNIVFYYAKIMTFMTIQHMDFIIRWASGKTSVRFRTIMTMRKLSVNMVVDRNFQKMI